MRERERMRKRKRERTRETEAGREEQKGKKRNCSAMMTAGAEIDVMNETEREKMRERQ